MNLRKKNKLGRGESEVLILAKKRKGATLLDDKRAREVAKKEKVECYGTLTLLKICYENGIVGKEELTSLLDKIIKKGNLYVTPELYDWFLE